jgi:hypothetical protein
MGPMDDERSSTLPNTPNKRKPEASSPPSEPGSGTTAIGPSAEPQRKKKKSSTPLVDGQSPRGTPPSSTPGTPTSTAYRSETVLTQDEVFGFFKTRVRSTGPGAVPMQLVIEAFKDRIAENVQVNQTLFLRFVGEITERRKGEKGLTIKAQYLRMMQDA